MTLEPATLLLHTLSSVMSVDGALARLGIRSDLR
jgi:hypothetical protein